MTETRRRPRAVVFDLDGLMFNTEDLYDEVGEILLARRGRRFTQELKRRMMGRPAPVSLQMMIDEHELEESVEQLDAEIDAIFAGLLPDRLQPMPGLLALLAAIESAGLPKAIATSSRPRFTRTVLDQFALRERFQFVITGDDVTRGKPDPEIYETAARRFPVSPAEMMVLEDSENGCRAAVLAGALAIAVPGHHSLDHDFRGAAHVARGLSDPWIYAELGSPAP